MRKIMIIAVLLAAACSGNRETAVHTLDATAMAALPELGFDTGQLVCTATGYDDCPLHNAFANRVGSGRIALWEMGRRVMLLTPGDTTPQVLGSGELDNGYGSVAAVARAGRNRYQLITVDGGWRSVSIGSDGNVTGTTPLGDPGPLNSRGFVGEVPILQRITGWANDTARFIVEKLGRPGDTAGTPLLDQPLPWLLGDDARVPPPFPLIATLPAWTLASDAGLIWSPGNRMLVERRTASGHTRWRVEGGIGPAVTEADLEARVELIMSNPIVFPPSDEEIELMRTRSDKVHPAVTGLTATSDGVVYVSGVATPQSDSVEVYRLAADGTPNGKFRVGRRTRILLAEGDSILVHQPTDGEPMEVRWMRVTEK